MANREILIDYYRVKVSGKTSFKQILELASTADVEDLELTVNKNPLRLEKLTRTKDGIWLGHLVKIRMDVLPKKAKSKQLGLSDLDLEPDEGIGEESSFLYHEDLKVLLFQRNYFGVRIESFGYYLKRLYQQLSGTVKEVDIDFSVIIGEDALKKLDRQNYITKLDARIAVPDDPEVVEKLRSNKLLSTWIDNLEETGSESLSVSLSMGHNRKSSMFAKTIKDAVRIAVKESDFVGKMRVRAKEKEEKSLEWIDLLEVRVHHFAKLDISRKKPLTHERMSAELFNALAEKEEVLHNLFMSRRR